MKSLTNYYDDWYYVLEHFYDRSEWVADITIAYKNKIAEEYK